MRVRGDMKVRSELIVEDLPDGGLLIVDPIRHRSHTLSSEAGQIWSALAAVDCDPARLAATTGHPQDLVDSVLARFVDQRLVAMAAEPRREFLRRAATVAGAAAGLALVQSIATPNPIQAQSQTKKKANPALRSAHTTPGERRGGPTGPRRRGNRRPERA